MLRLAWVLEVEWRCAGDRLVVEAGWVELVLKVGLGVASWDGVGIVLGV